MIDSRHQHLAGAQHFAGMIQAKLGTEQQAMGFGQGGDRFGGKLVPLQGDDVDTAGA